MSFKIRYIRAGLLAAALAAAITPARAEQKQVRIVVGTNVLNITYPWLNLPIALGYWREEGYDVTVTPLAPPAQSISLLVAGQADFAQVNSSVAVQARTENREPVKIAMLNGVIDWSVAVTADSTVKEIPDLKGKSIGVLGLASGGTALLRSYLQEKGIDPDKDVSIIAVGGGAPAVQALQSGRVSALVFWAGAMAGFENAGLKLRYMRGENWQKLPDFALTVMQSTFEKDPAMVEAIARGAAKAELFAFTNPDCVRRIQWKTWPATKPTGSSDEATLTKWDLNSLNAQLDSLKKAFELSGGKLYGNAVPEIYDNFQDYLLETKQITKAVPSTDLVLTPEFYQRVNNFDTAQVVADAKACKGY